jgi:hypothetical protein
MRAPLDEYHDESFDWSGAASAVAVFRAADDSLVAEVHPPMGAAALSRLMTAARSRGIRAIWVRGDLVSRDVYGFQQRHGYARLQANSPLTEIDASRPALALVPQLQVACFSGVWGHHRPAPAAYCELGFELIEYVPGWELVLDELRHVDAP